ncbi:MAG: hypothetical protein AAFY26_01010 [Cyanobacteria bacterium J06638_22]
MLGRKAEYRMQVWVTTFMVLFGLFFGIAELFPWLAQFSTAPPVFVGAGILLAIASNLNQPAGLPWQSTQAPPKNTPPAKLTEPQSAAPSPEAPPPGSAPPPSRPPLRTIRRSPFPPRLTPPPPRPISFTIKKPNSSSQAHRPDNVKSG